jgi:FlaA1/EpsC-like NDP-sugar epimerase
MRASKFTDDAMDWAGFLGRLAIAADPSLAEAAVGGRSVLITGAGGSIGSRLAAAALEGRPGRLVLLDVSESALYECFRRLSASPRRGAEMVPVVGSAGDARFVAHLLREHRPELVFHAAAYKHVPLMERNPFAAMANNAVGTYRLAVAAREAGVARLIAVSTDKAVNPASAMGASKRIAELAVLSHAPRHSDRSGPDGREPRMNVVRLCNVLGSSGSVAAIFQEQAEQGSPLTVTDAEARRYFLTPAEAERAILGAALASACGRVLVPDCGAEFRILDLARHVAGRCGAGREVAVEFTGLRPGEKLREELWSAEEAVEGALPSGLRVLRSPVPGAAEVAALIQRLEEAVDSFDSQALMEAVGELVPGYMPHALKSAENGGPSTRAEALAQDDRSSHNQWGFE